MDNQQAQQSSSPPQQPPVPPQQPPQHSQPQEGISNETKQAIVILLLVFMLPFGILFMWIWMYWWPKWVKWLITVPIIIVPLMALLLSFFLIAVNPAEQFAKANDTRRTSDLNVYKNILLEYKNEYGMYPQEISRVNAEISKNGSDICSNLVPAYVNALPVDPGNELQENVTNCNESYSTGYFIRLNQDGSVTLSAPDAELETPMEVTL